MRLLLLFCVCCGLLSAQSSRIEYNHLQPHAFDWMLAYAGQPTSALVGNPRFSMVRRYATDILKVQRAFDGPDIHVLLRDKFAATLGSGISDTVHTRLGRYVTASACDKPDCATRALLWVDTDAGLALAALIHPPLADLPSPQPGLILFSRQIDNLVIRESDLPAEFWFDFRNWSYDGKLAAVLAQRFAGQDGALNLLPHDEDYCRDAQTTRDSLACNQFASQSADVDLSVLLALLHERFPARNQALDAAEQAFDPYRKSLCTVSSQAFEGGTAAPVAAGDCYVRITRQHTQDLIDAYQLSLVH